MVLQIQWDYKKTATDRGPKEAASTAVRKLPPVLERTRGPRSTPDAQETRVCNITFSVSFLRLPEAAAEILLSVVSRCQHGVHSAGYIHIFLLIFTEAGLPNGNCSFVLC
jgi:hypothetical protein